LVTQRSQLAKRHSWRNLNEVEPSIDIIDYLGCTITLRSKVTASGSVRRSYTVIAPAIGTTWACNDVDDDVSETSDPRYLLEMAKCEIDFALEVDF
jgi:hypothetical protein